MKVSIAHIHYIAICGQMNVKDTSIHPEHPRDPPSTVAFHGLIPARPKRKWRFKKVKTANLLCNDLKMYLDVVFLNRKRPNCGRASTKYGLGISESQQQQHCNVLLHESIEEWCLRGVSLNRETSPVMSSLFLPPLSCLCTRSVHQILFYVPTGAAGMQSWTVDLLIGGGRTETKM